MNESGRLRQPRRSPVLHPAVSLVIAGREVDTTAHLTLQHEDLLQQARANQLVDDLSGGFPFEFRAY